MSNWPSRKPPATASRSVPGRDFQMREATAECDGESRFAGLHRGGPDRRGRQVVHRVAPAFSGPTIMTAGSTLSSRFATVRTSSMVTASIIASRSWM